LKQRYRNPEAPIVGAYNVIRIKVCLLSTLYPPFPFLQNAYTKHLSFLLVMLYSSAGALLFGSRAHIPASLAALGLAWLYLRYIQRNAWGQRGDSSDAFAFVTLFPEAIQ
jgi:hypothetical protein